MAGQQDDFDARVQAVAEDRGSPLTIGAALSDLGWFSMLFAVIVSGPSVLSILEQVISYRLADALQWIVDGYRRIADLAGGLLRPALQPVLDWLNQTLHWSLQLHPHWAPLFALGMVVVLSATRASDNLTFAQRFGGGALYSVLLLLGAILAGLVPLDGAWWAQALAVVAPLLPILLLSAYYRVVGAARRRAEFLESGERPPAYGASSWPSRGGGGYVTINPVSPSELSSSPAGALFITFAFCAFAAILAVALSFVPAIKTGAGVLVLGLMVLLLGISWTRDGLSYGARGRRARG